MSIFALSVVPYISAAIVMQLFSNSLPYLQELKKAVKDLNMETYVEFSDNLPQTKIIELLNKAKLLIHTSQFETFGLVAIEANT